MKFDSTGLGYTRRGRRIYLHRFVVDKVTGEKYYSAGHELEYPFQAPDANDITRERVKLIESLEDENEEHRGNGCGEFVAVKDFATHTATKHASEAL